MPKKGIFGKDSSLPILLSSHGLYLSSILVKCVEDVACKSLHNNFHNNNEQFYLYMFKSTCDMYFMLYIEHYLQPTSSCVLRLKFLSFRCPTLFDETCGSKLKG